MGGAVTANRSKKKRGPAVWKHRRNMLRKTSKASDAKTKGGNKVPSKKRERAIVTQLRHELREKGLSRTEIDEIVLSKKMKRNEKHQQQMLTLPLPAQTNDDNVMDITDGFAGDNIGITLGAPTVFANA
eukprot:gene4913-8706_t